MRKISTLLAIAVALCMSPTLLASIDNGDTVVLIQGPGGSVGGGSFIVHDQTAPIRPSFFTFCVERNEGVAANGTTEYYVTIEDSAIFGGLGVLDIGGAGVDGVQDQYDPLSPLTAWLYSNAVAGTLTGYVEASNAANDALQLAIWKFEDENIGALSGLALDFYNAAVNAGPTDTGQVKVMNLWTSQGAAYTRDGKVQSMLVIVPEASTIAVWSVLSLVGAGVAYRRRLQK